MHMEEEGGVEEGEYKYVMKENEKDKEEEDERLA